MQDGAPIPTEKSLGLCRKYCVKHGVSTFSQCWGCLKFSKGDVTKMCFAGQPGNRGCKFVNGLFDEVG
jgi:hypothetical protein